MRYLITTALLTTALALPFAGGASAQGVQRRRRRALQSSRRTDEV